MDKPANVDWTHFGDKYVEGKGGIRKIADAPPIPCQHPQHNFPGMIVLEPGMYEYECPGCGAKQIRNVSRVYM